MSRVDNSRVNLKSNTKVQPKKFLSLSPYPQEESKFPDAGFGKEMVNVFASDKSKDQPKQKHPVFHW